MIKCDVSFKNLKYILDKDKKIIPIKTINENGKIIEKELLRWEKWFENIDNRIVKQDNIGKYFISTVFLGLDFNVFGEGEPLLFETMVKNKENEKWTDYQKRYSTYNEALKCHNELLNNVKGK